MSNNLKRKINKVWAREGFFSEVDERRLRACNIIVYDCLNESTDVNDLEALIFILLIFVGNTDFLLAVSARRFGKARGEGNAQPLKASFSSDFDAFYVLRNKSKLSKYKLLIKNDLTSLQLNYLKELNEEIVKLATKGEVNLKIKYVRGIPSILKSKNETKKKNE